MENSLGKPIDRADARLKVTGAARYSAEIKTENLAYAVFLGSAIAKGKIKLIDVKTAETSSGILAVLTRENSPPMKKKSETFDMNGAAGGAKKELPTNSATSVLPLQADEIFYRGQAIACVVAETFEQAEHAANLIKVEYAEEIPILNLEKNLDKLEQPEQKKDDPTDKTDGDAENALKNSAVKIDEIYRTPLENHNAMEPHATLAEFRGDELIVHDTTRYVQGVKKMFAESFDLSKDKIRILAQFVGGAFGSKGPIRPHVALAAMCAMKVSRPVKLVLTRRQMTETTGHRADTRQRVALGAEKSGKLVSIIHEGASTCSATDEFVEPFTKQTFGLYAAPNRKIAQKILKINAAQPGPMRAPGEASGMFALESAMDELAHKLKIDPLEFRKINEPAKEPVSNKEFSCRRLIQCIEKGATAFGWNKRKSEPRSIREGNLLIGYGFASAVYPLKGNETHAKCIIHSDGRIVVQSSTHDFGNGIATTARQIAADALQTDYEKISFEYADSNLPIAPMTGGSTATMWVGTAVKKACEAARAKVLDLTSDKNKTDFAQILKSANQDSVEAEASAKPDEETKKKYAMDSYGALFCEVAVDADTMEIAVRRFTGVFNCGKILNPKLARSQFIGAITFGIGMALMEQNILDERNGKWIHADLNDYHVPVNADIRQIDVSWIDEPDMIVNPLGAKGVGEIGIVGAAAAIVNAVFNATGVRVRNLPLTADKFF